ncbi:MAG: sugar-binding protein [Anaerocolumna sp.]
MEKYVNIVCIVILSTIFAFIGYNIINTNCTGDETIGIILPAHYPERWIQDGNILKDSFEEQGYQVILTYCNDNTDKQIESIRSMIDSNVDLLIIAPVDSNSLSEVLNQVKKEKIPVISYDRLILNTDAVSYYVSFDNYIIGALQAQYIVDNLNLDSDTNAKYSMEIFSGDINDSNSLLFYNGAMDILRPYLTSGKITIPSTQMNFQDTYISMWDTDTASNRMDNILASYYSKSNMLDIALCANDSIALGVTNSLKSYYNNSYSTIITGQDGDVDNLNNIIDGYQSMTILKNVANEVSITLNLAISILNDEYPDAGLISASGWYFECVYDNDSFNNGSEIVPSYLITPQIVTINNYKELLINSGNFSLDANGKIIDSDSD